MFREMVIKLYYYFAYIPDKINYLRVGWIKFIYSTIEFMHYTLARVCNQLYFKDNLKKNKLFTDFYMHMQMMIHYLLQLVNRFKFIFSTPFIVY